MSYFLKDLVFLDQHGGGLGGYGGSFNDFSNFTAPSGTSGTLSNLLPKDRFKDQLFQLEMMGFSDKQANIQALTATNGNVEAAIEKLLLK